MKTTEVTTATAISSVVHTDVCIKLKTLSYLRIC